ncbi:hypothetical protein COLO4_22202 [Corchorus olitorius]|uniref:Uncharacterized protein n=1 Tax=Corchorus olitorius TaxID=93759 RepID=A0A1R3ING5_9ROSI|nr:hypothetical protein COLO4_22202 [Corchorus olitorius]
MYSFPLQSKALHCSFPCKVDLPTSFVSEKGVKGGGECVWNLVWVLVGVRIRGLELRGGIRIEEEEKRCAGV